MKKHKIDQSGKVENTNKLTSMACVDDRARTLKINSVEKQKLVRAMRALGYSKKASVLKIFATLIFFLIKDEKIDEVVVDVEYEGNEATIKNIIVQLFHKTKRRPPQITFAKIGKKSAAHKTALEVFRGKRQPDMIVKARDVMRNLYRK